MPIPMCLNHRVIVWVVGSIPTSDVSYESEMVHLCDVT